MKIIWALFEDGNCCVKKTLEKFFCDYKVYCIGINNEPFISDNWHEYHKIDLSIMNPDLLKELDKLPKPDIIVASPPCESWSNADTIKNYKPNSLELNNYNYFLEQNQKFYANKRKHMYRNFYNKQKTRLIGEMTQIATSLILRTYQPKLWYIENPATSRCWLYQKDFLNLNGIENKTYYNCYNYPIKKATIFKSNIDLQLKHDNIKSEIAWEKISGYNLRSSIPEQLKIF